VSAKTPNNALNIYLDSVPAGDDYFLIFLNTSHGSTYTVSSRFSILPSGTSPSAAQPSDPSAATITVSGSPHPTAAFATTFAALSSGTVPLWPQAGTHALGAAALAAGALAGGLLALW
jgi:hypothetical protein